MKKSHYEAPTSELLVVRFEENIMSDPTGYKKGGGGVYKEEDIFDNGDY